MPTTDPTIARCSNDDAPLIDIRGHRVCVLEYVMAHLQDRQIVDVVPSSPDGATIMRCACAPRAKDAPSPPVLFFADGHALPLYCACCGKPLVVEDEDEFLERVAGLWVVGVVTTSLDNADAPIFWLALAHQRDADPNADHTLELPLALESARALHCPRATRRN